MAYGLLKRILSHAKEQGWLKEGDVIVDPFFGIGSTGILGAYEGYYCIGIELEKKFCLLAEQNFKLHDNAWKVLKCPKPIMIQGDSRRLCEVVEKADCIVSSPPFIQSEGGKNTGIMKPDAPFRKGRSAIPYGFSGQSQVGETPGQLGAMKPGNVDMVVSSPPYAEAQTGGGIFAAMRGKGNYKLTTNLPGSCYQPAEHGKSKENLGNLKSGDVDCVLGSPPYEKAETGGKIPKDKYPQIGGKIFGYRQEHQGCSKGQLGQDKGDTFWQAAKIIVEQCFQILKPGGHAIWVVKSFVRNKKIVDFPGDWQRLCESVGFKTVCIHHAMLVKETKHQTLFGHTEVKRKERKSFFRRLAESKGSPPVNFECVLCMEK